MRFGGLLFLLLTCVGHADLELSSAVRLMEALLAESSTRQQPSCVSVLAPQPKKSRIEGYFSHHIPAWQSRPLDIRPLKEADSCLLWVEEFPPHPIQQIAFSRNPQYLKQGVLAAFSLEETHPRVWLNPDAARKLGMSWPLPVLRLMKLVSGPESVP